MILLASFCMLVSEIVCSTVIEGNVGEVKELVVNLH